MRVNYNNLWNSGYYYWYIYNDYEIRSKAFYLYTFGKMKYLTYKNFEYDTKHLRYYFICG